MSLRTNALVLGTVVAATFAVGMAGAESTTAPTVDTASKSDRFITGGITLTGNTLTVEYRGENLSFLARVPVSP